MKLVDGFFYKYLHFFFASWVDLQKDSSINFDKLEHNTHIFITGVLAHTRQTIIDWSGVGRNRVQHHLVKHDGKIKNARAFCNLQRRI